MLIYLVEISLEVNTEETKDVFFLIIRLMDKMFLFDFSAWSPMLSLKSKKEHMTYPALMPSVKNKEWSHYRKSKF